MWNRAAGAVSLAMVSCVLYAASGAVADSAGGGAEIVQAKCVSCHQIDMIRQQHLTKAGWQREVDKMIRWGAPVTDAERDALVEYLAAAPEIDARGAEILRQRCLGCHQADMIEQQRLGTAAWGREVDKMVRWGASVSPTEKDALVSYLTKRFRP